MDRRYRLLLVVMVALAGLAAPGSAVANAPVGTWQITGIVLDGHDIAATGKLSLSGTTLGASVGCNSIGGQAKLDGNTLTITGDLATTLIGCPADIANAENALLKILSSGPITVAADRWTSAAGEIDTVATGTNDGGAGGATGCIPPIAPGANPPDGVTVPCGSGNTGSGGTNGSTVDPSGPSGSAPGDPLVLPFAIGIGVLLLATIAAYIYLGPRRASGGEPPE